MGGWRYIAERLNGDGTGTILDVDVPLADAEIEDVVSGPLSLSGKISPEIARLKDGDGNPLFLEWSTALYAEKDGEIRGGGILVHSGFSGPEWGLECVGFTGYAKDMPYVGNGQFFIKTDTLDIVRSIWGHIQGQPEGNIGLVLDQRKSGVLTGSELASEEYDPEGGPGGLTLQSQAYKLAYYQDHDLSNNIDSLAESTPFDYHERHFWKEDGPIGHALDFGVPAIGRRRNDLRFVLGENIFEVPGVERSGEDYASEVYGLGAGEGSGMIRGHAMARRGRLRRVAVVSDSSMRYAYQANAMAAAELRWRQQLDDITEISVRDHPHARIGSISPGDEIFIEGKTGWIELGTWARVVSITIRPDDASAMKMSIVRSDRLAA